jgi:RHS repeat-associated protein
LPELGNPLKTHERGLKLYELKNHLGNVISVVSDRLLSTDTDNDHKVNKFEAEIVRYSDYYPFGFEMPDRAAQSVNYRYGFNGMEKDNEVIGDANSYTTEFRTIDVRIGRWWSLDPITHEFQSPYCTFDNNPIYYKDPSGADGEDPQSHTVQKGETLTSIAKQYSTDDNLITPEDIINANSNIDWGSKRRHGNQNWVFTGEKLNIPRQNEQSNTDENDNMHFYPQIDVSNIDLTASNNSEVTGITYEPNLSPPTAQDGVLRGVSAVGNISSISVNQTIKNGFWLGKNSKGVLTLYGSNFHGNQYVVKTDVHIVNLKSKIKIANNMVSAAIITNYAIDYLSATSEDDKEKALNELYTNGAIWIISAISAEAAIIMGIGEVVVKQPETQFIINNNLLKISNDNSNPYNYQARKAYERRYPSYMKETQLSQGN